jgi:hypothetical protein
MSQAVNPQMEAMSDPAIKLYKHLIPNKFSSLVQDLGDKDTVYRVASQTQESTIASQSHSAQQTTFSNSLGYETLLDRTIYLRARVRVTFESRIIAGAIARLQLNRLMVQLFKNFHFTGV